MRLKAGWRAVAWGLVAVMVLEGCATVALEGVGGSGGGGIVPRGPLPGSSEWEALEDARRAEIESAIAGMWGVLSEVREVGAELEFTFWAEGGALTLLSLRRRDRGRELGGAIAQEGFASDMRELLPTYVEGKMGAVRLKLLRQERRWQADYTTAGGDDFLPLEAKAWPVRRVGVRAEVLERLTAASRELTSRVWAPSGAQVRWNVEVALEDEWVRELETQPPLSLPGGASVRAAPETVGTLVNVLAPFTQGLGPRKVRLELEGTHIAGTGLSRWKVVAAEVIRPPPPKPENAEVALEYKAMHEEIQRRWREESREGLHYIGAFTLEQLALWIIGGVVARGVGLALEAAAPTIARVLARGGANAVGWFRAVLARAAPAEKQVLAKLMAKAETQGLEVLTAVERSQLQTLIAGFERRLTQPLSEQARTSLRTMAREDFYVRLHPELAKILVVDGHRYPIHHKLGLEFAHLFPEQNINAATNLAAVNPIVHGSINRVWNVFRSVRGAATPKDVLNAGARVDAHFGRWYNRPFDASRVSEAALSKAEEAALKEMKEIVEQLLKGQ